jgi:hypothetical protein
MEAKTMTFIKATTTEGKIELFNTERILTIQPKANGTTKILMGAGLYWNVITDSIEIVDCINDLLREIRGGNQ